MKSPRFLSAALALVSFFTAALALAQPPPPPPPPPRNPPPGNFGQALPGLSDAELAAFLDGRAEFQVRETPATGLGPIFNDVSCVACHSAPAVGGGSRTTVTRFGRTNPDGSFDPLTALGGSLLQDRAIRGATREVIPAEANVVAHRITTPLFGAGLIEAIPDLAIVANAVAPKPAGIHGKISFVDDVTTHESRVGRFGWKAQQATLLAFAADAYLNEMGITNRFFPHENAPNGNLAALAAADRTAELEDPTDPVDGKSDTDRLADFMRLLAPPQRTPLNGSARAGERLFTALDCAACHTPAMTTGRSDVAALSEKRVDLFSDLLLHDMGSLGDGIAQGTAGPREIRTPPLWGVRVRRTLLHDGRVDTVDAAIRAHEGEAANSRDAYLRLSDSEQRELRDFLDTL